MKKIAFLLSKAFFWGFTLFSVFVLLFSILSFLEYYFNWNIPFVTFSKIETQDYASIKIPIMELTVKFLFSYTVIAMWLTFIFYSIYFYALQNFFAVFISEKTFEENALKKLEYFYKLNFIPIIISFITIIISYFLIGNLVLDETHFIFILHIIIGFLLYLHIDLVKKGMKIQQENDLTI